MTSELDTPVIQTRNLTRVYGRRVGVEGVDLSISPGEVFGFLGPNGAGKTTTIRLLLGFLQPTLGDATILGMDCWTHSARVKREIGYLPGDLRLYPWFSGRSALKIVSRVRGMDVTRAGAALAERFRMELDLRVRKMSRGMRQKLGLILAPAHRPRLLILDEPTSGLDPLMQDTLANYLRELAASGSTIFFSSHTLGEVENLCDRIAVVRQGRVVADETLDSLRGRARRRVRFVFAEAAQASQIRLPSFLRLVDRQARAWICELEGPAIQAVRWAAEQPLEDVSISPPDLESLFRAFYEAEA